MPSITDFGIGGAILQKQRVTLKFSGENCVSIAGVRRFRWVHPLELPRGGNQPPTKIIDWAVIVYA